MDERSEAHLARDARGNMDLAESIYGALPSRALDCSSADIRASSMSAKRLKDSKSTKRKGSAHTDDHCPSIALTAYNNRGYFITTRSSKRGRLHSHTESQMDMHQSTCLNLNTNTDSNESDLWILPDFDEWEVEAESPQQEAPKRRGNEWAPLVQRAVNSNRERLRRRLEGDGWDFVGGKYGEDGKPMKEVDGDNEESVDEEFDVVVLPVVEVSC